MFNDVRLVLQRTSQVIGSRCNQTLTQAWAKDMAETDGASRQFTVTPRRIYNLLSNYRPSVSAWLTPGDIPYRIREEVIVEEARRGRVGTTIESGAPADSHRRPLCFQRRIVCHFLSFRKQLCKFKICCENSVFVSFKRFSCMIIRSSVAMNGDQHECLKLQPKLAQTLNVQMLEWSVF
jgi:hypothetical protein